MGSIVFDVPPVGVKFVQGSEEFSIEWEEYRGVSYCDAVRLATSGRHLTVKPGSIEVCKWVPVVFGFKEPEHNFEWEISPRLEHPGKSLLVAPLSSFSMSLLPDVVIFRGSPDTIKELIVKLGEDALTFRYRGDISKSALASSGLDYSRSAGFINAINRVLSKLKEVKTFDRFTKRAFKSLFVTSTFEKIIRGTLADMSICRNSTVIPYLEGKGNVSFFCPGGVTWGGNIPGYMVCGFPFDTVRDMLLDEGFFEYSE